jgi:uncharacterized protein (DUF58 family)
MIVPSRRLIAALVAGTAAAAMPAIVDPRLWIAWLAALAVLLAAAATDALLCLPERRLDTRTGSPDLLHIGERGELIVTLETPRWRRATRVETMVELDADLAEALSVVAAIPAVGRAEVNVPLVPRRRGELEIRTLWLRWDGPAGLVRRISRRPIDARVKVVPNIRSVQSAALRFFSNREFMAGLKVERYVGEGSEFEQLREFAPGFDARSIDWKSSARHMRLLCREFRAERNQQVVLAFDTGYLMGEPLAGIPKLDHAVNAALLLAYVALKTGDRVGFCAFDESVRAFVEPRGGVATIRRLEERSAALAYSTVETNFTLGLTNLLSRLDRRSLVVLFTDFVDSITAELMLENVGRLSRRHLVLFVALRDTGLDAIERARPDSSRALHRAVAAGDLVREREVVLRRLERLGVLTIDVAPDRLSSRLINRYLEVKRRELVA